MTTMMSEAKAKRRARQAYDLGVQAARSELSEDLRNLAGFFALEMFHLRQEVRAALGLPPLDPSGEPVGGE